MNLSNAMAQLKQAYKEQEHPNEVIAELQRKLDKAEKSITGFKADKKRRNNLKKNLC